MKGDHSKRNELILLIVSNVLVAVLFIADWGRNGFAGNANNWLPSTNLFAAWLIFFIASIIQLICILVKWPLGTIIVSALKTIFYGLYCALMITFAGYKTNVEITGLVTLFEAYGNVIMGWLVLAVGLIAFVLDIVFCIIWMRRKRGVSEAKYSKAEKTWLAGGIIAVLLWFFMAMTYYLSAGAWEHAVLPTIVYIALGAAWWFASRHGRVWSVILFVILTVLAVLSLDTVYLFYICEGPVYAFLPILEIAALIVWYVFLCILFRHRWPAGKEKA